MKNCNQWTKEAINNVNDHPFMQQIQRPWSTKDFDLGIKSIMHFAGKDDVDEITVRSPEDIILNAKSNVSPGTYVYECSVPSKWLGHKVYIQGGEKPGFF